MAGPTDADRNPRFRAPLPVPLHMVDHGCLVSGADATNSLVACHHSYIRVGYAGHDIKSWRRVLGADFSYPGRSTCAWCGRPSELGLPAGRAWLSL